jgi:hypothetical protein
MVANLACPYVVGFDLVSCGVTTEDGGVDGARRFAFAVVTEYSLSELSGVFDDIGSRLVGEADPDAVLEVLAEQAVARVPGAEYAGSPSVATGTGSSPLPPPTTSCWSPIRSSTNSVPARAWTQH